MPQASLQMIVEEHKDDGNAKGLKGVLGPLLFLLPTHFFSVTVKILQ